MEAASSALTAAVTAGDTAKTQALLEASPAAASATPWGEHGSLLHLAASCAHAEVCARSKRKARPWPL
jgi:hypothetical protein